MKLWSIQTRAAYETLRRDGYLWGDGRRCIREFRVPYSWMKARMKERVPGYEGRTLLWAWASPKPDLRKGGHLAVGVEGVRLELEVDPARVLCSDWDGWHFVLNRMYLPLTPEEYEEHRARWEAARIMARGKAAGLKPYEYADIVAAEFKEEMEATWPRIFDLPAMGRIFQEPGFGSAHHEQWVQAVLDEINVEDVVGVTRFVGRG